MPLQCGRLPASPQTPAQHAPNGCIAIMNNKHHAASHHRTPYVNSNSVHFAARCFTSKFWGRVWGALPPVLGGASSSVRSTCLRATQCCGAISHGAGRMVKASATALVLDLQEKKGPIGMQLDVSTQTAHLRGGGSSGTCAQRGWQEDLALDPCKERRCRPNSGNHKKQIGKGFDCHQGPVDPPTFTDLEESKFTQPKEYAEVFLRRPGRALWDFSAS